MNHSPVFVLIITWHIVNSKVTDLIVSHPNEGNTYRIGETVSLTCIVEDKGDLSVLFQHVNIVAENGHSYTPKYTATSTVDKSVFKFLLTINKLQWSDHGLWECIHGSSNKAHTIVITVVGSIQPLVAQLDYSAGDKRLQNDLMPHILYGKGIKTNPFDLTRNSKVKLICRTGCSYPQSKHEWKFRNISISSQPMDPLNETSSSCKSFEEGKVTESFILVGCDQWHMVGSNEVTCTMKGSNESQSVFVLCPGGHRAFALTNGEIIGLSIAVGLAALMLVLFFMSAKKIVNSYRYGSVAGGIRV